MYEPNTNPTNIDAGIIVQFTNIVPTIDVIIITIQSVIPIKMPFFLCLIIISSFLLVSFSIIIL